MADGAFLLCPVGWVESSLINPTKAPNQGDEGAPDAVVVLAPEFEAAAAGIAPGDEVLVLTWLDRARRGELVTHPRGDPHRPLTGVFATRSSHRPNPIGIHPVTVLAIEHGRIRVSNLDAIDGTPVIDIKPMLGPTNQR